MTLSGKNILITGGTGSLGGTLLRKITEHNPNSVLVFSRDEAKQYALRATYAKEPRIRFQIGDIRDFASVNRALRDVDVVFNAAALKQVPSCEEFPYEAVQTNIAGAQNIIRSIQENRSNVELVVGISTDKACKPVNVMGMTKAIQERLFLSAQSQCPRARFVCVRYGNVLASRGSVIPLFREQIKAGGPVRITSNDMTRFLLTLDQAADTVFDAASMGLNGDTFVPYIDSARVRDIANVMIGHRNISIEVVGIRPGEKTHEVLISEEELPRVTYAGAYYIIGSAPTGKIKGLSTEYSSNRCLMSQQEIGELLEKEGLLD